MAMPAWPPPTTIVSTPSTAMDQLPLLTASDEQRVDDTNVARSLADQHGVEIAFRHQIGEVERELGQGGHQSGKRRLIGAGNEIAIAAERLAKTRCRQHAAGLGRRQRAEAQRLVGLEL